MQFFQITLTFLLSIAFSVLARAQNVSIPQFELLFSGPMSFGPTFYVDGPFGMRQDGSILGGNMSDPNGNLVATVVANTGSDRGLITNGTFYPDAKFSFTWVDGHHAYLHTIGVGQPGVGDTLYVHMETDSPTYYIYNSLFMIATIVLDQEPPIFAFFGQI